METWRIVTPIVILILGSMGVWYSVILRTKEIRSITFVHPKSGHHYIPLYRCMMKCPASGEWFDAIVYQRCNTKEMYVMDMKDFLDKFVKLKDYENGNNSKQGVSEAH